MRINLRRHGVWVLGEGDKRNEASGIGVAGRSGEGDVRSKHETSSIVAACFSIEVTWTRQATFTVTISSL